MALSVAPEKRVICSAGHITRFLTAANNPGGDGVNDGIPAALREACIVIVEPRGGATNQLERAPDSLRTSVGEESQTGAWTRGLARNPFKLAEADEDMRLRHTQVGVQEARGTNMAHRWHTRGAPASMNDRVKPTMPSARWTFPRAVSQALRTTRSAGIFI